MLREESHVRGRFRVPGICIGLNFPLDFLFDLLFSRYRCTTIHLDVFTESCGRTRRPEGGRKGRSRMLFGEVNSYSWKKFPYLPLLLGQSESIPGARRASVFVSRSSKKAGGSAEKQREADRSFLCTIRMRKQRGAVRRSAAYGGVDERSERASSSIEKHVYALFPRVGRGSLAALSCCAAGAARAAAAAAAAIAVWRRRFDTR